LSGGNKTRNSQELTRGGTYWRSRELGYQLGTLRILDREDGIMGTGKNMVLVNAHKKKKRGSNKWMVNFGPSKKGVNKTEGHLGRK